MSEQQRGYRSPTDGARQTADDVEGHRFRWNVQDEPAQDDVEGHGARWGGVTDEPAQDDVVGHASKIKF